MSGLEVFGFDEDLVTDFEVWCWRLVFVGGDLVLFLSVGDCRSELLVKFIEVHYKIVSMGRDKVAFGVDGDVQIVALVGEEG